ncbi:histidine phosphatase superfamily protein (branch 1) [Aquimarina sp. MAR_2010_214]|uniref:SixA phosphatase family protein n=1 Tax=Aquimarina sp. MAR_2010_214 TaxID=1250026 RepID=UPI000C7004AB|nr:phosphoglycerate mutase family protein [Aquimarina sp. MAR_2010_214]PKV52094.1 histidine phosphatase superfamily protein (branch 1) [Aquimarina sp. MAR_2010_214]
MKSILILFAFLSFWPCSSQDNSSQQQSVTTTYFFVRHAEKDLSDPKNRDPKLTTEGKKRAANWAKMLADTPIDMVYTTDYTRTRKTAEPIAKSKNLELTLYNPRDLNNIEFQKKTKGKTVVIVGHSNTTPTFVNTIIGKEKYSSIDEKIYGKLFILKVTGDIITDTVLTIN